MAGSVKAVAEERPKSPIASAGDLLAHLEGVSGKVFYTRQDINVWLNEVREDAAEERKASKSRKSAILLIALVVAFLQYEVIDIMIQVNSLRSSAIMPTMRSTGYRS